MINKIRIWKWYVIHSMSNFCVKMISIIFVYIKKQINEIIRFVTSWHLLLKGNETSFEIGISTFLFKFHQILRRNCHMCFFFVLTAQFLFVSPVGNAMKNSTAQAHHGVTWSFPKWDALTSIKLCNDRIYTVSPHFRLNLQCLHRFQPET